MAGTCHGLDDVVAPVVPVVPVAPVGPVGASGVQRSSVPVVSRPVTVAPTRLVAGPPPARPLSVRLVSVDAVSVVSAPVPPPAPPTMRPLDAPRWLISLPAGFEQATARATRTTARRCMSAETPAHESFSFRAT